MLAPSHSSNHFDTLRLFAALLVWWGHCFALTGRPEPLEKLTGFVTFGSLGVGMFFIISGYFITQSYEVHGSFLTFARNRILRIMPALVVVVFFCAFVLGPCVTALSLTDYFHHSETLRYLRSALVFPLQYTLPGVFTSNPQTAVNGSLWTLQHEMRCYGVVAILGVLGILRPRVVFFLLAAMVGLRVFSAFIASPFFIPIRPGKLEWILQLGALFASGSFLYLARVSIPENLPLFLLSLAVMVASCFFPHGYLIFDLALAYAVIYLGFSKLPLPNLARYGDISYGLYLYAFPMQQFSVYVLGRDRFIEVALMSLLLTIACAVASWNLIERQALKLKQK